MEPESFYLDKKSPVFTRSIRRYCVLRSLAEIKEKLKESFIDHTTMTMAAFNFERVIDLLYDLRCDVVHEGKFWAFKFSDGEYPILHVDPKVTVHLTFIELRDIVVRGCINAIKDKLKP